MKLYGGKRRDGKRVKTDQFRFYDFTYYACTAFVVLMAAGFIIAGVIHTRTHDNGKVQKPIPQATEEYHLQPAVTKPPLPQRDQVAVPEEPVTEEPLEDADEYLEAQEPEEDYDPKYPVHEFPEFMQIFDQDDVYVMAQIMWCEAHVTNSDTEIACVGWTICNRHAAGYGSFIDIMTAPRQYAYYPSTVPDEQCLRLAEDVLVRYNVEYLYGPDVPGICRVLPKEYMWFEGDGRHNHFRDAYKHSEAHYWNYSLESPYDS